MRRCNVTLHSSSFKKQNSYKRSQRSRWTQFSHSNVRAASLLALLQLGLAALTAAMCIVNLLLTVLGRARVPTSTSWQRAMLYSATARYMHPDIFCLEQHRLALEFAGCFLLFSVSRSHTSFDFDFNQRCCVRNSTRNRALTAMLFHLHAVPCCAVLFVCFCAGHRLCSVICDWQA